MKNAGPEYFFKKKLNILAIDAGTQAVSEPITQQVSLNFYPEGGDMVLNLPTRLAFEVTGSNPELEYKGKIYNDKDEEVATFGTLHEGRGVIDFVPTNAAYYAKLEGSNAIFELPQAKAEGLVLTVNNRHPE